MARSPITDEREVAAAIRLEYELLRGQIADMDRTCVVVLGLLITGTLTILGVAFERTSVAVAWFVAPLWTVGHMYLTEKRLWIVRTGGYIRTELEPSHEGLGWESWLHDKAPTWGRIRRSPYALETTLAVVAIATTPPLVLSLSGWDARGGSFVSAVAVAIVLLGLVAASATTYHATRSGGGRAQSHPPPSPGAGSGSLAPDAPRDSG